MSLFPSRPARLTAAVLLSLGLLACQSSSEADLLASAQKHLEQRETKSAIIQLQNAIQKYPESVKVRMAMGQTLLNIGDADGAAVEFEKALDLRGAEAEVLPLLARAMAAAGQAQQVIQRFEGRPLPEGAAGAEVLAAVAGAHLQLNRPDAADRALVQALERDPNAPWALVLLARRQAAQGQAQAALASLRKAEATHPDKAQVLTFEGELRLAALQDDAGAERAFTSAVAARNTMPQAHAALVALAMKQQNDALARSRLDTMAKVLPQHPKTWLLQAQMALADQQMDTAERLAQQLLQALPQDTAVHLLAGEVAARTGSLEQAETHLGRVLQRSPDALAPRKLLAQAYLQAGEPTKALKILEPAIQRRVADGALVALAGQAQLKLGQGATAQNYFKVAAQLSPDDPRIRTASALSQMERGHPQAVKELEAIAREDRSPTADMALISARLQQRDWPGALQAIAALERKQPTKALAAHLEGRVHLLQGDAAAARRAWDRALGIDSKHFPSAAALASLDASQGQAEAGLRRLEQFATAHPQSPAQLALAELKARTGSQPAAVQDALFKAVQANPDQPSARVALIQYKLAQKDASGALKSAQEAVVALPQRPEVLEALARAQTASGDQQQALSTLRKLVDLDPKNPQRLMLLADLQSQQGDRTGLRSTLKRVVDLQPGHLPAVQSLVALELQDKRPDAAVDWARRLQEHAGTHTVGLLLEGDISAQLKAWDGAAKAYRAALKRDPSSEAAIKLHGALMADDRKADADKMAQEWEKKHPQDAAFLTHLGETVARRGQWAAAEKLFVRAQRLVPENPMVLNNLAYVLAKQHKSGAVGLAEKANQLLPGRPALMDTLALALASERQVPKAVEVQRKAVEQGAQQQPELRLHLAELYLQAGDRSGARQELQTLAALGPQFTGQRQVNELLRSL